MPSQGQFEDLENFAKSVRERIANDDWDPSPESKRQVLGLLHAKVMLSKDGTGKVTGWFGETSGFSYIRRSHSALQDRSIEQSKWNIRFPLFGLYLYSHKTYAILAVWLQQAAIENASSTRLVYCALFKADEYQIKFY